MLKRNTTSVAKMLQDERGRVMAVNKWDLMGKMGESRSVYPQARAFVVKDIQLSVNRIDESRRAGRR
ncbi:hypothetical protein KMZ68_11830 [Bradyrhizobium sediminis]|uniref:Uncharacterized protein n=1 Tax=Bradyrhizobium sediminis TaxID=2840469 RepID=A0A975NT14_9BRAD|nr:hypothetical protein [Bradyrhizobium sediminis]QWG20465.1 hypothetical protein KMZ68_11830 [Bradyrhizobium sediminis]